MEREGFASLTMDKLVAACSYSKGTVYNHFNSKEDLLCALCIKGMRQKLELSKKAMAFEGNTREKCLALHFSQHLHGLKHPTMYFCVLTAKTPAVKEKASAARLQQQAELELEMTQFCDGMFAEALKNGDLKLGLGFGIDSLSFANWAMSFGTSALLMMAKEIDAVKRMNQDYALLHNISFLLDGMGWQPLSSQWDYMQSWQRIADEVFKDEIAELS